MSIRKAISQRIMLLCAEQNLSVNGLARKAAIPPSTLKNIINGVSKNPGSVTIKKICDGLEISIIEFYNDKLFQNLELEIK